MYLLIFWQWSGNEFLLPAYSKYNGNYTDPSPILEDLEWVDSAHQLSGIPRPHSPAVIPHSLKVRTAFIIHPPVGRRDQNGKKTFRVAARSDD